MRVTLELEVENDQTGAIGFYGVEADVTEKSVLIDWKSGGIFWQGNDGEEYGPYEYEPTKYEEDQLMKQAFESIQKW